MRLQIRILGTHREHVPIAQRREQGQEPVRASRAKDLFEIARRAQIVGVFVGPVMEDGRAEGFFIIFSLNNIFKIHYPAWSC